MAVSRERWCDSWPPRAKRWRQASPLWLPLRSTKLSREKSVLSFQAWPNRLLFGTGNCWLGWTTSFVSPLLILLLFLLLLFIYKYPIWGKPDQINVLPCHHSTPFSSVGSELGVPLIALMCLTCVQSAPPPAQVVCLKVSSLHLVRLGLFMVLHGFSFEVWGLTLCRWTRVPTYFFFFFWYFLFQKLDVFAPLNTHLSCPPLNTLWLCLISRHNEKGKGFTRR